MKTSSDLSTLEILPDEILLEICKYLLCSDVLYSFYGLNYRMTCMISQYCQQVSLYKAYISNYEYLCENVLPHIGSQIRSLILDCEYSVLQDVLFNKYFGDKMSSIFPNLERVTLISYVYNEIMIFLDTLHDLHHLVEIHLYGQLQIPDSSQSAFIQALMSANNHRITTVLIDDRSTSLTFDNTLNYSNILRLRIGFKTLDDFCSLFPSFPNIQYLDVIIEDDEQTSKQLNDMKLLPLPHLIDFRLNSTRRLWRLEELMTLVDQLPSIKCLSLFLGTSDKRFIKGNTILSLLPLTVQQFNYAIALSSNIELDEDDTNVSSWPLSYPITYFSNDRFLFLHTIPWYFPLMKSSPLIIKMMSSPINETIGYNRQVKEVYLNLNKNLSLKASLVILSKCYRLKELVITNLYTGEIPKEEQPVLSQLPRLSRLLQIFFLGTVPADLNSFSLILNAAPNLCRLDLPFSHLRKLMEDEKICHLLGQRITSLSIMDNQFKWILPKLNEEHISTIASTFSRLRDLYVDITHLPCGTSADSNENDLIVSNSSESMLVCLLTNFKDHRLIELCADGLFIEQIKTNPEQWLEENTILCQQKFKANFINDSTRLLIWM